MYRRKHRRCVIDSKNAKSIKHWLMKHATNWDCGGCTLTWYKVHGFLFESRNLLKAIKLSGNYGSLPLTVGNKKG